MLKPCLLFCSVSGCMGTLTLSPLHAQRNNENVEIQFQITSHTRTPISLISKLQSASKTIFHAEHQLRAATKLGVYTLKIPVHAV